jgi:hypothetical protein
MAIFGGEDLTVSALNAKVLNGAWVVAICVVLLVIVTYKQQERLDKLEAGESEGMRGSSAAQIARERLGGNQIVSSGQQESALTVASKGLFTPLRATQVPLSGSEAFLGRSEAPVFYDIGDVRATRAARQSDRTLAQVAEDNFQLALDRLAHAKSLKVTASRSQADVDTAVSVAQAGLNAARGIRDQLHGFASEGAGIYGSIDEPMRGSEAALERELY